MTRVGIIDIGSNTARLLVADVTGDDVEPTDGAGVYLRLGAEIERRGTIRPHKVSEAALVAGAFAQRAGRQGAERAEVLVTAPGRQAHGAAELIAAVERATGWPVRVLSHRDEAGYAFDGAVARAGDDLPEVVGMVDVGGGSTELAVGTPILGVAWVHSVDVGSLRLTRRILPDDPPTRKQIEHARKIVMRSMREATPPSPDLVLAVGGSARALGRALGSPLTEAALNETIDACAGRTTTRTAKTLGVDPDRAATIVGGAILLAASARVLGHDLTVARGGVREGAALALAHARL